MVPTRNSLTNFIPYAGYIAGLVTTGASPTVTLLPGSSADQANVTITRGGVGVYTITVDGFAGPAGAAIGVGSSIRSGVIIAASTGSYSGGTMSMQFGSMDNAGAYTDTNFNFEITAY
jgi:hypothetical protein